VLLLLVLVLLLLLQHTVASRVPWTVVMGMGRQIVCAD